MGCSFIAGIQDAAGSIADMAAPVVAAIPGPWQIPAMAYIAVTTVENGGDLGDVIKKVGTAYIAGEIGGFVGESVSGALAPVAEGAATAAEQAAINSAISGSASPTLAGTVGNIAGSAATGATRAALGGGDVGDAIVSSIIAGGINAGVQDVTGQIEGFNSLPPSVQNAAKNAISAELQGRDPTNALVNSAISAGYNAVKDYQPSMAYNYDPANNPADPNADSNPDLNGSMTEPAPQEPVAVDQSLYPVQDLGITPENMDSYQQTLKETVANGGFGSQWVPNDDGTYTMTYDDGSTVQADVSGNILNSTNATDTMYTGDGTVTPAPKVTGATPAPKVKAGTPAPKVTGPSTNLPPSTNAATGINPITGKPNSLVSGSSVGPQEYALPNELVKLGNLFDVGGTSIFNLPDRVKSSYATGGSIDDLMVYLRNKP